MSAIFFFFPSQQLAAAPAIESFLLLGLPASPACTHGKLNRRLEALIDRLECPK